MAVVERYVQFVFSEMQVAKEKEINAKIGKVFQCGEVSTGASTKKYSKIIRDSTDLAQMLSLYPDTKIIADGVLNKMNYTEITTKFKK